MTIAPDGRPPFRADHIGSLLRPAELRHAFRDVLARRIDEGKFRAIQDAAIRGVVRLQEEVGLQVVNDGEYRRGSYWGRFVELTRGLAVKEAHYKFHDDQGHELGFTAPHVAAGCVAGGRSRWTRSSSCAASRRHSKVTLPAPSTMHFYRGWQLCRSGVYESPSAFFADLGRVYQEEIAAIARSGARYVQLDEVRSRCSATRGAREGEAEGRTPRARRPVRRRDQPGGREPTGKHGVGVHMCRGNYKGLYLAAGRLRLGRGAALPGRRRQPLPARVRHASRRRLRAAALPAEEKGVVLGLVSSKVARSRRWTSSSGGPTRPRATSTPSGSRSARSAASPARSPATRSGGRHARQARALRRGCARDLGLRRRAALRRGLAPAREDRSKGKAEQREATGLGEGARAGPDVVEAVVAHAEIAAAEIGPEVLEGDGDEPLVIRKAHEGRAHYQCFQNFGRPRHGNLERVPGVNQEEVRTPQLHACRQSGERSNAGGRAQSSAGTGSCCRRARGSLRRAA